MRTPRPLTVTLAPLTDADVSHAAAIDSEPAMTEKHLRDELARPFARCWAAHDARELAGYLVSWHVADELHVLNVATHPAKRRRGVGRAMMRHVVDYARSHRLKHLLLEVRRSNRGAIALYRSVGFFAMGVRSRYYADDEDAVEMVLLLDPDTGAIVEHADEVVIPSQPLERT